MKRRKQIRNILIVIALIVCMSSSGQQNEEVVINMKLIEKFNNSTAVVEDINWMEVINEKSFQDAKLYINVYNNLNSEELNDANKIALIQNKIDAIKRKFEDGIDSKPSLANAKMNEEPNFTE